MHATIAKLENRY